MTEETTSMNKLQGVCLCPICLEDDISAKAEFQCKHYVCLPCLENLLNVLVYPKTCPMCRELIRKFTVKPYSSSFKRFEIFLNTPNNLGLSLPISLERGISIVVEHC